MTQVVKTVAENVVVAARVLHVSDKGRKAQISFPSGKNCRTIHLARKDGAWTDNLGWRWPFPAELTVTQ